MTEQELRNKIAEEITDRCLYEYHDYIFTGEDEIPVVCDDCKKYALIVNGSN